jgi:hypothetical protein
MKGDICLTSRFLPGFPNMVDLFVGLLRCPGQFGERGFHVLLSLLP